MNDKLTPAQEVSALRLELTKELSDLKKGVDGAKSTISGLKDAVVKCEDGICKVEETITGRTIAKGLSEEEAEKRAEQYRHQGMAAMGLKHCPGCGEKIKRLGKGWKPRIAVRCTTCGKKGKNVHLADKWEYCPECGEDLEDEEEEEVEATEEEEEEEEEEGGGLFGCTYV